MSNFSNGERLLNEAKRVFGEVERAYAEKAWNTVIRRSQETVELSLKGLLKMMCIDYPKEHDVGKILGEVLNKKEIEISKEEINEIESISAELTEMRAPSFYFEKNLYKRGGRRSKGEGEEGIEFCHIFF